MSHQALERHKIVSLVEAKAITQDEGAGRLEVTRRHMQRIMGRYQEEGISGLNSKRYGKRPGNAIAESVRKLIVEQVDQRYVGFGPTLVSEKLAEEQRIVISIESTRQIIIRAGQWLPKQGVPIKRHPMRDRRERFGEMIQIDGSLHDWFEGRSPLCTLLVFIDDATGQLTQLRFMPTETRLGYMQCLFNHIISNGIPMALYSDRHATFRVNGERAGQTQFERATADLGIELICANSPQAKGRVERTNQTLQDRLVKEMRLQGINNPEEANVWLPKYVAQFNARFAVQATEPEDAHAPYTQGHDQLREILSEQTTRKQYFPIQV